MCNFNQTTDNGGIERSDSSAVPAVCCTAVPQQPRAADQSDPPASRAALPTVYAAALPSPVGTAAGRLGSRDFYIPFVKEKILKTISPLFSFIKMFSNIQLKKR